MLTRTWGNSPRSDWTPPRGSERFYSCEMFMIESRSEKKEDGLRGFEKKWRWEHYREQLLSPHSNAPPRLV